MADALCVPHKNRNSEVLASRIVNGVAMCSDCYEGKPIQNIASRFSTPSIHVRGDDPQLAAPAAGKTQSPWRTNPEAKTPPVNPEEKKKMPRERTDLDWNKIQNERSDGASVAELSRKYKVANSMIYTRTKAPASGRTARAPRELQRKITPAHSNGDGSYAQIVALLRAKRDALTEVIDKLESLN